MAVTVTSFLLVITYLETGNDNSSIQVVIAFLIIGIISLAFFILLERTMATNPLVDFKTTIAQNRTASKFDNNDCRDFYVYGISDNTHSGKKPCTTWLW